MANIFDLIDTWASGGGPYTSIKMNATDNDAASASLLMDLQVGSTSWFSVGKTGLIQAPNAIRYSALYGYTTAAAVRADTTSLRNFVADSSGVRVSSTFSYGFTSASDAAGTADLILSRRGAANLRFGAADAAGSAIAINSVATNQLTLASSHGLTSGAAVIITGTTAPSGTSLNTLYYARSISAAVIELYSTFDQATATSGTTGIVAVTTAGTSASIRLATPFQRLSPQDFTGTDIPGQPLLINGSRGTGTGTGGSLIFQVAPAGSTGTAQNALATALTIGSDRIVSAATGFSANGTNSPRSYALGNSTNDRGLEFFTGGNRLYYREGSTTVVSFGLTSGLTFSGTTPLGWAGTSADGNADTILARDTTNTLALRNSTAAQRFNVYNTYTSSTNYEAFKIDWITTANTVLVGTEKGSVGGTARGLEFQTDGVTRLSIAANGAIGSIGYLAVQPSGFTNASILDNSGNIQTVSGGTITFSSSATNAGASIDTTIKRGGASGVILLGNSTTPTDFSRLQFGGTSASFPALKRNGAGIDVVGADGTNVSFVRVPGVAVASLPSAATAGVGALSFVTDANMTMTLGIGTVVAGGGANKVPVYSDGTNWLIG